jgi:CheY-like chemotaxis protein
MPTMLIIDDEPAIGLLIRRVAETCGYRVTDVADANRFKSEFAAHPPDVIALDLTMPDTDGIELLRYLAAERCSAPLLIVSGYSGDMIATALRLGQALGLKMAGALHKPVAIAQLRTALLRLNQRGCAAPA